MIIAFTLILYKNLKRIFTQCILSALLVIIMGTATSSCSQPRFDKTEQTIDERYSIVYKESKCGVYDNEADSLVTKIKYDALQYRFFTVEDNVKLSIWCCKQNGAEGLLSIARENNEFIEILLPAKE